MARVGFLLGGFQDNGGIGRVVSIISNALVDNYEVITISYCKKDAPMLYSLDESIIQVSLYDTKYSVKTALFRKQLIRKLKDIINQYNIDFLIACGALFFPVAVLVSKTRKTRCICWEHSNANNKDDHKFQLLCRWVGAKFGDAVIVLTKQDRELYEKRYSPRHLYQIYNPIDPSIVIKQASLDNKRIITVGRLCYQKNYPLLLEVAKKLFENYPEWDWDIYGEGPDREEIEILINEYNLSEKVHLMGQVSNLYGLYKDYSFLVMTSRYEGFSMALLEAMANGLPLVAFDVYCGPSEVISDGENGYLINAFNEVEMQEKIEKLCRSEDLRKQMGNFSIQMMSSFSIEKIINKWVELFREEKKW